MIRNFVRTLLSTSGRQQVQSSLAVRDFASSDTMQKEIEKMIQEDKVVLFMKGNPEEPLCGFSKAATTILRMHQIPFASYDVLQDESLRQGIKEYTDWPTIPQLYVNGKFVGGCDILISMHKEEKFADFFESEGIASKYLNKEEEKPKDSSP